MRRAFSDHDEEEFRSDHLVRMAAIEMDPLYGKPIPPTHTTAAQLIQLAEERQRARSGRKWIGTPVLVGLSVVLVAVTAGVFLTGLGHPTPAPSPVQPAGPPSPVALPVRTGPPVSARTVLAALANQAGTTGRQDTPRTGQFTYIHTRAWSQAGAWADVELWWGPGRAGRAVATRAGKQTITEYREGEAPVGFDVPSADIPILASQLAGFQDFKTGPRARLRAVVDMYRYHVVNAAQRAAAIRVLADTDGLAYEGDVADAQGRSGAAISVESDEGRTRDVAVFDRETGYLLSYERVALLSPARSGVREPVVIASVLFLAGGYTDVIGHPPTS